MNIKTIYEKEQEFVAVKKLTPLRRILICKELGLKTTMEPYRDDEEVSEKTKKPCPTCGR
ncbi:MAG: hypothetical protein FWD97_07600 [Defluviitaleaceae bacterium]|nr:hypothetical protein [Defluviitaleaceae bacterium]